LLLLLYTGLSLAGMGTLRLPGVGYAADALTTDLLFRGLAFAGWVAWQGTPRSS